ncbi:MAG: DNRLRE domain-containing protein [Acidimicrobiales bacterium]|nr:DNRLRE domain-containing protein [Acidimicrobiales bacterium]
MAISVRRFGVVLVAASVVVGLLPVGAGASTGFGHAAGGTAATPPLPMDEPPPGATTSTIAVGVDDTYVAEAGPPTDRSSEPTLQVGFDGTGAHRTFLHVDDVDALAGQDIFAARLSVWQESSTTCPASPLEVRTVRVPWAGTGTTTWPGPETATFQAVTADESGGCGPGWVTADVSRLVERWSRGLIADEGLALLARNEGAIDGFRSFSSADGGHPPVLEVWSADASRPSHPWMPFDLVDSDFGVGGPFTLSARYRDPEGDEGRVVFFTYDDRTGAYLGAYPSQVVAAETVASVTPSLPFDVRVRWRAMSVDAVHGTTSHVSRYETATRFVVRSYAPLGGDMEALSQVQAFVDAEVGAVTGVRFAVDGVPIATDPASPWFVTFYSQYFPDGPHSLTATVVGGPFDGHTSPVFPVEMDNDWWVVGPDLALARTAAGPLVGDNRFDRRPPFEQRLLQTVDLGQTRRFVLRLQNDRFGPDSILLEAEESGAIGYAVRFRAEGRDVTSAVRAGTYEVGPLDPGEAATVKVLITAGADAGSYRAVDLTASSALDAHAIDVVRARVDRG